MTRDDKAARDGEVRRDVEVTRDVELLECYGLLIARNVFRKETMIRFFDNKLSFFTHTL